MLHGNSSYAELVNIMVKAIREKASKSGDTLDSVIANISTSDNSVMNNVAGPQSPDNDVDGFDELHIQESHPVRRRKTKTGNVSETVTDESLPLQKMLALDPLSEISLSMAILARTHLEKSALGYLVQPSHVKETKIDCKNDVHQYFVSPDSAFVYCRVCGNIIKPDSK